MGHMNICSLNLEGHFNRRAELRLGEVEEGGEEGREGGGLSEGVKGVRGNRRGQWEVVAATLLQVASCGGEWGKECVHKWVWVWRRGCRHCNRGGSGRGRGSRAPQTVRCVPSHSDTHH